MLRCCLAVSFCVPLVCAGSPYGMGEGGAPQGMETQALDGGGKRALEEDSDDDALRLSKRPSERRPSGCEFPYGSGASPVVIRCLGDSPVFSDPRVVLRALNASPFAKVYVEGTCRVLGRGAAIRFEVSSLESVPALEDITEVAGDPAPIAVRCWRPRADDPLSSCGVISPVDPALDVSYLKEVLRVLGGGPTVVTEVTRVVRGGDGGPSPTRAVRIRFRGPLPAKVSLLHTAYAVLPYRPPLLRCFVCHALGHGSIYDVPLQTPVSSVQRLPSICRVHQVCLLLPLWGPPQGDFPFLPPVPAG